MKTTKLFISTLLLFVSFSVNAQLKVFQNGNVSVGGTSALPWPFRMQVAGNSVFSLTQGTITSAAFIRGLNVYSSATTPDYTWFGNDITGLFHPGLDIIAFSIGGTEKFRVHSNGYVGIGTGSPIDQLHVSGGNIRLDSGYKLIFSDNGSIQSADNNHQILFRRSENKLELREYGDLIFSSGATTGAETAKMVVLSNGNVGIGTTTPGAYKLYVAGTAFSTGSWVSSDSRFKKNIKAIESPLEKIMKINGKTYEFKKEEFKNYNFNEGSNIGFIAQELKEILPEVVKIEENGYYSVNYDAIIPLLIEGIKEQQTKIESMRTKIESMQVTIEKQQIDIGECCKTNQNSTQINQSTNELIGSSLYQNIPNPFTENTQINYTITNKFNDALISVFDMQGALLKTYNHLILNSGKGAIIINGGELKAGMYMYSLIIDGKEIDTKRMILTK